MFRSYEPERDRLAAVKAFRLDITPEQARALADQLRRLVDAGLVHPSIVAPLEAGVEASTAYLAEEYVAGESLDVAIRHYAPAAVDKALPFIAQLAGAIDFARAGGIGHGTLHPRDIFITPDEARATGFGIANALESIGVRPPVRRPYSAPERVAGAAWGAPADVFTLAAIAYELLTGRRIAGPVKGPDALASADALDQSRGSNPILGSVVGPLSRALAEDPAARYQSALAFARALEAAADGEMERDIAGTVWPTVVAAPTLQPPDASAPPPAPKSVQPSLVDALEEDTAHRAELANVDQDVATPAKSEEPRKPLAPREPAAPIAAGEAAAVEPREPKEPKEPREPREPKEPRELREPQEPREPLEAEPDVLAERDADLADVMLRKEEAQARPPRPAQRAEPAIRRRPHVEEEPAVASTTGPMLFDDRDRRDEAYRDDAAMRGFAAQPDRPRAPILPLAIVLIAGLLVGFVAGYAVGTRAPEDGQATRDVTQPTAPAAAAPTSSAPRPAEGRDVQAFSEQKVADVPQPAAATPAPPPATTPTPAREGQPALGTLTVRSTPSKVGVVVDGRWRGRTPLRLDDLSLGEHTIRVVERGYVTQNSSVTLTAEQRDRALNFTLPRERARTPPRPQARTGQTERTARPSAAVASPSRQQGTAGAVTRFLGSLFVDSRPRGARVILDGRPVGTTPLQLGDIAVGSHVVRLELAGHRPWTSTTRVVAGETARVTGSLEQVP